MNNNDFIENELSRLMAEEDKKTRELYSFIENILKDCIEEDKNDYAQFIKSGKTEEEFNADKNIKWQNVEKRLPELSAYLVDNLIFSCNDSTPLDHFNKKVKSLEKITNDRAYLENIRK